MQGVIPVSTRYTLHSEILPNFFSCDHFELKPGDTVIMSSDGLWDNVFDKELLTAVNPSFSAKEIAKNVYCIASRNSQDTTKRSPFQDKANKTVLPNFRGGKKDDMSVIVISIK